MFQSAKRLVLLITILAFSATSSVAYTAPSSQDEINLLVRVLKLVRANYVRDVRDVDLYKFALEGLVRSVDPYAAYLSQDLIPEFEHWASRPFGPLGAALSMEDSFLTVVAVADGSPAAKAGLQPFDKIVKFNGEYAKNLALPEVIRKTDIPEGEKIDITLLKRKANRFSDVTVTRKPFQVDPVWSQSLDPNYLYLKVTYFSPKTETAVRAAIHHASAAGDLKGIILDLRNNPGGLLDAAQKVAGLFLDKPSMGFAEGKGVKKEELTIPQKEKPFNMPIVVLIDGTTAGSAEALVGALQDYERAVVIGAPSLGKASIQSLLTLSNGAGVSLTTAYIETPKGKTIQKTGIQPDMEVKSEDADNERNSSPSLTPDEEDAKPVKKSILPRTANPASDPLVTTALEWLKSGKKIPAGKKVAQRKTRKPSTANSQPKK